MVNGTNLNWTQPDDNLVAGQVQILILGLIMSQTIVSE